MANKVEIIVVAKNETKSTFDKVKADAEKTGKDAGKSLGDGVSRGLADTKSKIEKDGIAPIMALMAAQQRLAKAAEASGKAVAKFGEDSRQAGDASLTLARATLTVESAAKKATAAIGAMSPALRDSLKQAGTADKDIDNLAKSLEGGFKKVTESATKAGLEAGGKLGAGLVSEASTAAASLSTVLAPVIVGAMGVIAPLAGAVLSAGVIGAAGTGGLVGGILLAAQDPQIAAAFSDLGTTILNSLKVDASVFKGPILEAIPVIQAAFNGISDDIGQIFDKASTWVAPLADAIASVVTNISTGLNDLVQNGDGVMSALFDGIKQVGESLGDMFSLMSENGPAAATALTGAFALIVAAIDATSIAIDILTKSFGFLAEAGLLGPGLKAVFEGYSEAASEAKTITDEVAASFGLQRDAISETSAAMQKYADDLKAQTDPMFALMKAQEDVTAKQIAFNNAVAKYGADSLQAKQASEALGASAVDLQGKSAEAAGTFDGKLSPALIATMKAAKVSQAAIDVLSNSALTAQEKLDAMAKVYTVTVKTVYETSGAAPAVLGRRTGGAIGAAATGGVRNKMTLVGEDGPELVSLPYGSSVHTSGKTSQMLNKALREKDQGSDDSSSMDWSEMLDEMREMRKELARNSGMAGNVYLDSRLVGSVQGRQANLYERTS